MTNFSSICSQLLPVLGVVALIFLIVALFKLVKFLESLTVTVNKTHGSIEKVELSLDKVQAPLDSVVNVSKHIDEACDATGKAINDVKDYVSKNIGTIKDKLDGFVNKAKKTDEDQTYDQPEELKEVSLDDILGKGE